MRRWQSGLRRVESEWLSYVRLSYVPVRIRITCEFIACWVEAARGMAQPAFTIYFLTSATIFSISPRDTSHSPPTPSQI